MFGVDHIRKKFEYLQLQFARRSALDLGRLIFNLEFHIRPNSTASSGAR